MKKITVKILMVLAYWAGFNVISHAQMMWEEKANVCSGRNFDLGIYDSVLVVMSDKYYELNTKGEVLFSDATVIDKGQAVWDYAPTLTVAKNGTVHIITRGEGRKEDGFVLLYHSKKIGSSSWIHKNIEVVQPIRRNYVVDIVPTSDTNTVYFAHMSIVGDNVNAKIHFYKMTNTVVDSLGAFDTTNYQRADADFRMEVFNDTLYLLSGYPDPRGKVYFMHAKLDDNLPVNMEESRIPFTMGEQRKGCPNIAIDTTGSIHILYGSKYKCHYHKLYRNGLEEIPGKTTFHSLNEWSLQHGIGAMAVSSNGKYLLSLALQTDGTGGADNCQILWNISNDGGDNWTYQKELGITTNGTEGRIRPRIVSLDSTFYAVFYDKSTSSLSYQKIVLNDSTIPTASEPQFLPEEEEYVKKLDVTFANEDEFTFFYTTNGTIPTMDSKEYINGILLKIDAEVNVMACQPGLLPSYVSKTYYLVEASALRDIDGENSPLLLCYPNPFTDRVFVQFNNNYIGEVQLQITDIQGRILKSINEYKSDIIQTFECDLENITNNVLIISTELEGVVYRKIMLCN